MNEDKLNAKLKEYIIPKIKAHHKGRPFSVTTDHLIDAIFLCSQVWYNLEGSI
jgi:hypothetical protein